MRLLRRAKASECERHAVRGNLGQDRSCIFLLLLHPHTLNSPHLWKQVMSPCSRLSQHEYGRATPCQDKSIFSPTSFLFPHRLESKKQTVLGSCFWRTSVSDVKQLVTGRKYCSCLTFGSTSLSLLTYSWLNVIWRPGHLIGNCSWPKAVCVVWST